MTLYIVLIKSAISPGILLNANFTFLAISAGSAQVSIDR